MVQLTLDEVSKAIPEKCFEKNALTSLYYMIRDYFFLGILYFLYPHMNHFLLKFLWWNATGFIVWCIFVIGHDCGHGSFSEYWFLNEICGQICHTVSFQIFYVKSILVPYHGWRISHRNHHMNHNNIHKDKTFVPLSKEEIENLPTFKRYIRFSYFLLMMFPIYLTMTFDSTEGNHFNSWNKRLFKTTPEFYQGLSSLICNVAWLSFLFYNFPILTLIDAYFIPVVIFGAWLVLVTFLHHTDDKVPLYTLKF